MPDVSIKINQEINGIREPEEKVEQVLPFE
jgi:hypothetical protein